MRCPFAKIKGVQILKLVLNSVGWLAILSGAFNGAVRVFGTSESVARYAGSSRNLDLVIIVMVFGLILIALASIIARLDELLKTEWMTEADE